MGLPGLLLLVTGLLAPLAAGLRSRRSPLVALGVGAYLAFLAHAGIDWDWELTGLGSAALLIGVALARSGANTHSVMRPAARGAATVVVVAVSAIALLGLVGEVAIQSTAKAMGRNAPAAALADLNRAERWLPWSSQPDELRANVWIVEGKMGLARAAYLSAIDKDRSSWLLWSALASVSTGQERERALAEVRRLNPPSS